MWCKQVTGMTRDEDSPRGSRGRWMAPGVREGEGVRITRERDLLFLYYPLTNIIHLISSDTNPMQVKLSQCSTFSSRRPGLNRIHLSVAVLFPAQLSLPSSRSPLCPSLLLTPSKAPALYG
ncbi:hypothetical protein E2C01_076161 [Portunus trituberculatus]|uniref:Uncharacterized protein n=1 Tax=Portunus trituberculatus TaxID=210409 RepID=A0A5B7II74_PORTR|nr:hypothetical protein [Portunus trituberculatus]